MKLTFEIILDDLDRLYSLNVYNNFTYSADEIIDYIKRVFNYEAKKKEER